MEDDEDTLDNHAIDQLLAACMRLVPRLRQAAGAAPRDNSRCFADRAAAAGFDVVTGDCDVLLVDNAQDIDAARQRRDIAAGSSPFAVTTGRRSRTKFFQKLTCKNGPARAPPCTASSPPSIQ